MIQRFLDYIEYQKSIPSMSEISEDLVIKYSMRCTLERLGLS